MVGFDDLQKKQLVESYGLTLLPSDLSWPVFKVDTVTSTNDLIEEMAAAGFPEGTTVYAQKQTQGRGRRGSEWFSSADNLQFSVLLRPLAINRVSKEFVRELPFINILSAYAVAKALYAEFKVYVSVKWPNDLMVGNRKICGVMSEMRSSGNQPGHIVLGCGLNVNVDSEHFPPELRSIATSVFIETGERHSPEVFMHRILGNLKGLYEKFLRSMN